LRYLNDIKNIEKVINQANKNTEVTTPKESKLKQLIKYSVLGLAVGISLYVLV
jgi:hypothetical protein